MHKRELQAALPWAQAAQPRQGPLQMGLGEGHTTQRQPASDWKRNGTSVVGEKWAHNHQTCWVWLHYNALYPDGNAAHHYLTHPPKLNISLKPIVLWEKKPGRAVGEKANKKPHSSSTTMLLNWYLPFNSLNAQNRVSESPCVLVPWE